MSRKSGSLGQPSEALTIVDIIYAMEEDQGCSTSVGLVDDNPASRIRIPPFINQDNRTRSSVNDAYYYDPWDDFDSVVDDTIEDLSIEDILKEEESFRPSLAERYAIEIADKVSALYPTSYSRVRDLMLDFYRSLPYASTHRAICRLVGTGISPEELSDVLIAHELVRQDTRFWAYRRRGRYIIPEKVPGVSWDVISKVILEHNGKDPQTVLVEAHSDWISLNNRGSENSFNSFKDYISSPWVGPDQNISKTHIEDDVVFYTEKSPTHEFAPGIASAYWGPQEIIK